MEQNKKKRAALQTGLVFVLLLFSVIFWKQEGAFAAEQEIKVSAGASTEELQAALDENADGKYSKLTVVIPDGTYELTRTLYISSNTVVKAGKKAVLLKKDTFGGKESYGAMVEGRLVNDKGGYGSCHDIEIIGGVWDSKEVMKNTVGTETFRFIHCSNITIQDAVLCNVPEGSHLIVFAGCKKALVKNCEFYGYGKPNGEPKEAVQLDIVHDNVIVPTQQAVTWDDLPCEDITVTNCNFHDFSRAVGSHMGVRGVLHTNVVITDNKMTDIYDTAIKLFNYMDTVVSGNTIDKCVAGILVYTDMPDVKDIYLKPLGGTKDKTPSNYNIMIKNNKISNVKKSGDSWGDGIRVMGTKALPIVGVTVANNSISQTERSGIYVSWAPSLVMKENTVKNAKNHALYVYDNCTGAEVQRNLVLGTGKAGEADGIRVSTCNQVKVTENTVKAADSCGIYLYKSQGCTVTGNRVGESVKKGIYLTTECQNATVGNNVVSLANDKDGGLMLYQAANSEVTWNTVRNLSGKDYAGIRISNSDKCKVESNISIGSMAKRGIWVTSSNNCAVALNVEK